jgi:hypothetical protein
MPDERDSGLSREVALFSLLCEAHLRQGGKIGLMELKWKQSPDLPESEYAKYIDGEPVSTAWWNREADVVADIARTITRQKKTFDDVAFYPCDNGSSESGPTWRILKNYMSFLRIVLKGDKEEMGSILRRLDVIMRDAMYGDDLKKEAEKN